MVSQAQVRKAERFLELHREPKLLVLPNIWDPMGARLLEHLGYPAVATASATVAYSLGYDDGEIISFDMMLDAIDRIARSVDVPVTADIERGYGDRPDDVAENVRRALETGIVGINIEDSKAEGGALRSPAEQCDRIAAARAAARAAGVPLVINARTDVWLSRPDATTEDRTNDIIDRTRAYLEAGADCVYPVTLGDIEVLKVIRKATGAMLNVYASQTAASMRDLETAGIARLSLGPGLIKSVLTTMKTIMVGLKNYESYDIFTRTMMQTPEILEFVRKKR